MQAFLKKNQLVQMSVHTQSNKEEKAYYITILNEAIEDEELSKDTITFYIYCLITKLCGNGNGHCFASNQYLAEIVNVTTRKIQKALQFLKEKDYVVIEFEENKRAIYMSDAWYRKLRKTAGYKRKK